MTTRYILGKLIEGSAMQELQRVNKKIPDEENKKDVGKFKLLRGRHVEGKSAQGNDFMYEPGDVFVSKSDLRILDPKGEKFKPMGKIDEEAYKFNCGGYVAEYAERDRKNMLLARRKATREARADLEEVSRQMQHTTRKEPVGGPAVDEDAISADAPVEEGDDDYTSLTVAQLRKHADQEEIDLRGATTKADIIQAIRNHDQGKED